MNMENKKMIEESTKNKNAKKEAAPAEKPDENAKTEEIEKISYGYDINKEPLLAENSYGKIGTTLL